MTTSSAGAGASSGRLQGLRLGTRLWWGLVPLALLLWGGGALLVARPAGGLTPAPLLTLVLRPAAEFGSTVAVALALGSACGLVLADAPRLRLWGLTWTAAAVVLATLSLLTLTADVLRLSPFDPRAAGQLVAVVDTLTAAQFRVAQLAALALAAPFLALAKPLPLRGLGAAVLLVAAGLPAAAGHTGLSGEHAGASVAAAFHVGFASVWFGGLAVVVALLLVEPHRAPTVLPRFSVLALLCFVVVAETGVLAADLLVGSVANLLGTLYGSIVLAKLAVLAWLALLGYQQRRRAVDRLPDRSVPTTVAQIASVELVILGAAVAAGVTLSRIGPALIAGTGFAPLTLVVLGLAVPMLAVAVAPGTLRWTRSAPEVAAVLLLLAVVEIGGVGLLRYLLGSAGLAVEVVLLVFCGWLAISSARAGHGLLVLAVGMPVAVGTATLLSDRFDGTRMTVVAVLAAEALLVVWSRRARIGLPAGATPVSTPEPVLPGPPP